MRIAKRILLVIVIVIAIPLIGAFFIKKDIKTEKSVTINRPNQVVFDYIKLLKNQDNFSVWAKIDPNMKKEYKGTDGTVGFVAAWDSNNKKAGKGEQEITKIEEGKRIDFQLRFLAPMEATNEAYMTTAPVSDSQTIVKWGFVGKMNYPMNFMLLFMNMDEMVGNDFQTGLDNLKAVMEAE